MNYMCFDIGGTSIKYGVAQQNGRLLLKGEMPNKTRKKGVRRFIGSLNFKKKYIERLVSMTNFFVRDTICRVSPFQQPAL